MIQPHTVGHMMAVFDHKENASIRSIVKLILPEMEGLSGEVLTTALNQLPMSRLEGTIDAETGAWAPEVEAFLRSRGFNSHTHLKHNAGTIRRFLERTRGLASQTAPMIKSFPCWDQLTKLVDILYPGKKKDIDGLVDRGVTVFGGYDLTGKSHHQIRKTLQNLRSNFNKLRRECCERDLTVKEFGDTVLRDQNFETIPTLVGWRTNFYDCKRIWNWLREVEPSFQLPLWPDSKHEVSIPAEACPDNLLEGIEASLFDGFNRPSGTESTYREAITTFFGILEAEGFSLFRLTKGLTPRDAVRLVMMGFPRALLTHDPAQDTPYALGRRLQSDHAFRDMVIDHMRQLEGSNSGQACVDNPFVRIGLDVRKNDENLASARNLVMRVSFVNKHFFDVQSLHYQWIKRASETVNRLEKERKTKYDAKKLLAFENPRLWLAIRDRFLEVEEELLADVANPTHDWAVKVARTALFHLLLIYPLRKANFNLMRIGAEFDPNTFEIHLECGEVKNRRRLDLAIPRAGLGRGLYDILKVYLDVARPIILSGKQTPYLFVPEQTRPNSGLQLRRTAMNDWLKPFVQDHLADVMPEGLIEIGPHLFRHITASWALVIKGSVTLAAQLLGDRVETVLSSYSDVLASAKKQLLDYYESADEPVDLSAIA